MIHTPEKPVVCSGKDPNAHAHKESVRTQWHEPKPSIKAQAGFAASWQPQAGPGIRGISNIIIPEKKEQAQAGKILYNRKGKEVGELVLLGHAAGPTPPQLDP